MKKLILVAVSVLLLANVAYAAVDTAITSTSVTISNIFSIEFYSDVASVRYTNGQIAFPAVDPALEETMINTTAYVDGDLKSDVGVICRTNIGQDWALKIGVANMSVGLDKTNIAVYKPDYVYDRNTNPSTPYPTGLTKQWYIISDAIGGETIFTGSGGLQNSAPFGILATFSFAVLPTGQATPAGQPAIGYDNTLPQGTYNFDIVYTLTTTL